MRSEIPLQENCVLDSAEKWMLKGKLWMLTTIQSQYRVQKIDDSKSLDAKLQHPADAKIASTKVDAKIEAKHVLKLYVMQTLLSIYKNGR